jgi:hypothetical protein
MARVISRLLTNASITTRSAASTSCCSTAKRARVQGARSLAISVFFCASDQDGGWHGVCQYLRDRFFLNSRCIDCDVRPSRTVRRIAGRRGGVQGRCAVPPGHRPGVRQGNGQVRRVRRNGRTLGRWIDPHRIRRGSRFRYPTHKPFGVGGIRHC